MAWFLVCIVACSPGGALSSESEMRLAEDLDTFYVLPAKESLAVIDGYHARRDDWLPVFRDVLERDEVPGRQRVDVVVLLGMIREERLRDVVAALGNDSEWLRQAKWFYSHRIGVEPELNQARILDAARALEAAPSDDQLVVFLPFLDDARLAAQVLNRLIVKSDGAAAELVEWAARTLALMGKGDPGRLRELCRARLYVLDPADCAGQTGQ